MRQMWVWKKGIVGITVLIASLMGAALLRADPGDLDLTFGDGDGYVTTDIGGRAGGMSLVIDSIGRIVVAGYNQHFDPNSYFCPIMRYDPDGTLDTTFGDGGIVLLNLNPSLCVLANVTIDANERIVVAGYSSRGLLARFNPDGSPDLSFGDQG
ncbi:MAG TPA: delta-60 repeat domain-containing protein, partial [Phototrophicaceae bacterium]|nr:delta-60 repeat domain-containing protein [Phototrophicaceae bacterium]